MGRTRLRLAFREMVHPKRPYDFKHSVQNPVYYPTPIEETADSRKWFTMRWGSKAIGVRLSDLGSVDRPSVGVSVFSQGRVDRDPLMSELSYRFGWDEDYSPLYALARRDGRLGSAAGRLRGTRLLCAESLYDYLMISIFLQNTNVKRSAQMTRAMLEAYGELVEFDGKALYCFWTPRRILRVSEAELRGLRVGYRAKSFLRASQDCLKLDEGGMRRLDGERLRDSLLSIYGVGPASLDSLMRDVFHRWDALNVVPPWEAKIYHRLLGTNSESPDRILSEIKRRYGGLRALAIYYLFVDLAWRHREKPIEWFGKVMPY